MRRTISRSVAAASLLLAVALAKAERRPQYGGILRIELRTGVSTLDPAQLAADPDEAAAQVKLASQVFETLVRFDEQGEPRPLLSTGWTHDLARKRWVFAARPNVTFHNGASWEPPDGTILVDDREPIEEILRRLAEPRSAITLRTAEGAVVGTGPFRIALWDPRRSAAFEAHDAYWGGRPFLDRVEVRMGRPASDQTLDFELARADVTEVPLTEVRGAQRRGVQVKVSAPLQVLCLALDRSKPELARYREALSLAVDRNAIYSVLLQKQGEISGALLPQWLSGYAFVFPTTRDLVRARQLAAPAQTLSFAFDRQNALLRTIAERIILNASEAGVTLRPAVDAADVRLIALRVTSLDLRQALDRIAIQLQASAPAPPADVDLYEQERALIDSFRLVPLFHLPVAWQVSPGVRQWGTRQSVLADVWRLADVWVERKSGP